MGDSVFVQTNVEPQCADEGTLSPRSQGITYAIGDIHGRLDLLERAADAIMADLDGRVGRVICLGDYVDRGPDSKGVIEFLMRAQRDGSVTCLKGNHEDMMLQALDNAGLVGWWEGNGGEATMASYGGGVPQEHLDWMRALPTVTEAAGRLFVHAGFFPGIPLDDQDDDAVLWIRDRFLLAEKDFAGWPHIVHGHTPIHPWKEDPAKPELLNWRTNLDTAAFHTGVLTVGVFEGEGGPPSRVLAVTMEAVRAVGTRIAAQVEGENLRDVK